MYRTWLICLILVLLPWRGWAWSTLPVEVMASSAPWQAHEPPSPAHTAATRHHACHDGVQASAQAHVHPDQTPHHGCADCEVCHASAITAPEREAARLPVRASASLSEAPTPAPGRGRVHELLRPPQGSPV